MVCKELQLVSRIMIHEFEDPLLEKQFIIQINRNRRHLTPFQIESIQSEIAKKRTSEAGKIGVEKRWKGVGEIDEPKESNSIGDRVIQNYTSPSKVPKLAGKTKVRGRVIDISAKNAQVSPGAQIGLKFSTWSLRSIAGYVKEKKLIKDGISHTAIRDILIEYGVEWRHSKTVLGKSKNPDYDLKKAY